MTPSRQTDPEAPGEGPVPHDHADGLLLPDPAAERPRLIEEHHTIGPHGEDALEATDELGRRWYHLRPDPRRRYDLIGFNYTWWVILWILLLFIVFLPWGRGWGY